MPFYYKKSGSWEEVINLYYKENGTWYKAKNGFYKKDGEWLRFHNEQIEVNYTIDSDFGVDVFVGAGQPDWPVDVLVTVEQGVCISGPDPSTPALQVGSSGATFVDGSTVKVINKGSIVGYHGNGGSGGKAEAIRDSTTQYTTAEDGEDGEDGGPAIEMFFDLTLENIGALSGGHGGGGGGGGAAAHGWLSSDRCFTIAASGAGAAAGETQGVAGTVNVGAYCGSANTFEDSCIGGSGEGGLTCSTGVHSGGDGCEAYKVTSGDGGDSNTPDNDPSGSDGTSGSVSISSEESAIGAGGKAGNPGANIVKNGHVLETV